jgi:HD-like signal output (HDOD) protein
MESFTGGLLQDMAVPVISNVKEADYCDLIDQWNKDSSVNLKNLEREFIGFDHQAIGALMAEEWGFPDFLTNAILNHHEAITKDDALTAVKLAANLRYCQDESEDDRAFMIELISRQTELTEQVTGELLDRAFDEASEFASMFS